MLIQLAGYIIIWVYPCLQITWLFIVCRFCAPQMVGNQPNFLSDAGLAIWPLANLLPMLLSILLTAVDRLTCGFPLLLRVYDSHIDGLFLLQFFVEITFAVLNVVNVWLYVYDQDDCHNDIFCTTTFIQVSVTSSFR